jgi:RimJ/RimL family protein N-acetyltransferase
MDNQPLHTEFAGERLMTEGLGLVLRHAFRKVKLVRLEANIQPGNERSKVLIGGCGFQYQGFSPRYLKVGGLWRDHERWAIGKDMSVLLIWYSIRQLRADLLLFFSEIIW